MTQLPSLTPYLRCELLASRTRTQLDNEFVKVTRNTAAPRALVRPREEIILGAKGHPQGVSFTFDAITRARAHHLSNPTAIVGGWAAAAYVGLPFWANDAQTTLLNATRRRRSTNPNVPTLITHHNAIIVTPDPLFPHLKSVSAEYAAIECLQDIAHHAHSWLGSTVPGIPPQDLRSVQFLDAMRRFTPLDVELLTEIANNRYCSRRLKRLLTLSVDDSDSPPETTLRLIASSLFPKVETQIPIYLNRRLLTVADVGWRERKVALFYDGVHHLQRSQRDYDSEVVAALNDMGWKTMRVTFGMLRNPGQLQARIARML